MQQRHKCAAAFRPEKCQASQGPPIIDGAQCPCSDWGDRSWCSQLPLPAPPKPWSSSSSSPAKPSPAPPQPSPATPLCSSPAAAEGAAPSRMRALGFRNSRIRSLACGPDTQLSDFHTLPVLLTMLCNAPHAWQHSQCSSWTGLLCYTHLQSARECCTGDLSNEHPIGGFVWSERQKSCMQTFPVQVLCFIAVLLSSCKDICAKSHRVTDPVVVVLGKEGVSLGRGCLEADAGRLRLPELVLWYRSQRLKVDEQALLAAPALKFALPSAPKHT